jgi:hypothetical protein
MLDVRAPTMRQYAGFSTAEESNAFTDSGCWSKKDFLSLLIYRHTAVMIRITSVWWEVEKQELRSTLWKT